jgi:hypothetical protein
MLRENALEGSVEIEVESDTLAQDEADWILGWDHPNEAAFRTRQEQDMQQQANQRNPPAASMELDEEEEEERQLRREPEGGSEEPTEDEDEAAQQLVTSLGPHVRIAPQQPCQQQQQLPLRRVAAFAGSNCSPLGSTSCFTSSSNLSGYLPILFCRPLARASMEHEPALHLGRCLRGSCVPESCRVPEGISRRSVPRANTFSTPRLFRPNLISTYSDALLMDLPSSVCC